MQTQEEIFLKKIRKVHPVFTNISDDEKFIFLMSNTEPQLLTWIGKFIYESMCERVARHLRS